MLLCKEMQGVYNSQTSIVCESEDQTPLPNCNQTRFEPVEPPMIDHVYILGILVVNCDHRVPMCHS